MSMEISTWAKSRARPIRSPAVIPSRIYEDFYTAFLKSIMLHSSPFKERLALLEDEVILFDPVQLPE